MQHGVLDILLAHVELLDLKPEQKTAVDAIEADLDKAFESVKPAHRKFDDDLADAAAAGKIDRAKSDADVRALVAAVAATQGTVQDAMNRLHKTLDAGQRKKLIEEMKVHAKEMHEHGFGEHEHGFGEHEHGDHDHGHGHDHEHAGGPGGPGAHAGGPGAPGPGAAGGAPAGGPGAPGPGAPGPGPHHGGGLGEHSGAPGGPGGHGGHAGGPGAGGPGAPPGAAGPGAPAGAGAAAPGAPGPDGAPGHAAGPGGPGGHGPGMDGGPMLAKLGDELGLTPEQREKLRVKLDAQTKADFAAMKSRMPAFEKHMAAVGAAFESENFDAKKLGVGSQAPEMVKAMANGRIKFVELVLSVLTPEQRAKFAAHLREHAAKAAEG